MADLKALGSNPFFAELEKLANVVEANEDKGPMNPDTSPKATQGDADASKEASEADKEKELQKKKDEIKAAKEEAEDGEKEASDVNEWEEKIAAALPEFGALAKLYEYAQGGISVSDDLHKRASTDLDAALSGEAEYVDTITKAARDLFGREENLDALYSVDGVNFVVEKLADFIENDQLLKIADGEEGSFLKKVMENASDFVYSVRNLSKIKDELAAAQSVLNTSGAAAIEAGDTYGVGSAEYAAAQSPMLQDSARVAELTDQTRLGGIGRGVGAGLLAGGAIYGGKKLYDAMHQPGEEQVAGEDEKLLLTKVASGKLNTEYPIETGGVQSMSKQIVRDFLKLAGAAALIETANNVSVEEGIRKQASDEFDVIAGMGRASMDEAFIKVAQETYTEPQLHEIVAGKHTAEILSKVARFVDWNNLSSEELNKVAGAAASVAAKGVAGALSDAASNVEEFVGTAKDNAEGAGREYVGVVQGGAGDGKGTGEAGGGLVNNKAGYKVTNNPGAYDIEQTAAALEEAFLLKQAAADTFNRADAFIKKHLAAQK